MSDSRAERWKPEGATYLWVTFGDEYPADRPLSCELCGAVVVDSELHTRWHASLESVVKLLQERPE